MTGTTQENIHKRLDEITGGQTPESLASYLGSQTVHHQERIMDAWDFIEKHATPAFNAARRAPIGAAIATSYQEQDYITHSLGLYASQLHTGVPFRTLSYLNWPTGAPQAEVNGMRKLLNGFIRDNPAIPFAYCEAEEPEPFAIGRIRKLGTEVLLPFIHPKGLIAGHDADHRGLSMGHFSELLAARHNRRYTATGIVPAVAYERVPQLPNIDSVIQWMEDFEVEELVGAYAEPGPAFRPDDYVLSTGYNENCNIGETHDLIIKLHYNAAGQRRRITERVPSAVLTLSPRRIVEKLSTYETIGRLWTPANLTATDNYRTAAKTAPSKVRDLPASMRDRRLREYGQQLLGYLNVQLHYTGGLSADRLDVINQLDRIRRQRLGGPEDMFVAT